MPNDPSKAAPSELDFKAEELAIRRDELRLKAVSERRSAFFTSPLLIGAVGLAGTGFGAGVSGYWNMRLERQKFEAQLIQSSLATSDRNEAARRLKFLVNSGVVEGLNTDKIASLKPEEIPVFYGSTIRNNLLSVRQAKEILGRLGIYKGTVDDEANLTLSEAIAAFQTQQGLPPDGYLGPLTFEKMRQASPDSFKDGVKRTPPT